MAKSLNIMMVTSEFFPYAKAGGLADVIPRLAQELDARGHRVKVLLPRYYNIDRDLLDKFPAALGVPLGDREFWTAIYHSRIPGTNVEIYFLEHEELYGRDGIYALAGSPSFPDNALRFALLCRAAFQVCKLLDWYPDILHGHDWPSAPLFAYKRSIEARGPFLKTKTVFTIHNLGYQGIFPHEDFRDLGLDPQDASRLGFSYHGKLNFIQAALLNADAVTTVSPGYAQEVLQPELGFAMDKILRGKKDRFRGILNGMDYEVWNPGKDPLIPYHFDLESLANKELNKNYLQEQAGLELDAGIPLLGMVSRLVTQKGFAELLAEDGRALRAISSLPAQLVILGTGEEHIERELLRLAKEVPGLRVYIRYHEKMSHMIEAASDFFLMPSLYEPCGLTQMYALRYGTIPIVSPTGGLKDTVIDWQEDPRRATGFYIENPLSPGSLIEAVSRAVRIYQENPSKFREMQERGMVQRFDWEASAALYEDLFLEIL